MMVNKESVMLPFFGGTAGGDKGDNLTLVTSTLLKASWENKVYSFESSYPVASFDILELQPYGTLAQVRAFYKAACVGSPTANTLTCLGVLPTIDIPVMFYIRQKEDK